MKYSFFTAIIPLIFRCGIILLCTSNLLFSEAQDLVTQEQTNQKQTNQSQKTNGTQQGPRGFSRANPRRKIVASDLSLHTLLVTIQANINGFLQENHTDENGLQEEENKEELERRQNLALALRFASEAIVLLEDVVFDLNQQCFSYNPEIEYHFVKMCNILKDVDLDSIEPYQIRAQHEQVKKFDQYLKLYCLSRKDFLNKADSGLFNKVTKLNHILMVCLLSEEHFDIGFFHKFLDYTVHRPWELMCQHPYITAAVAVGIIAPICYFYIYPWWMRYDNHNANFNVRQVHGLKQGRADCGYYGLLHALMLRNAQNEEDLNGMIAQAKAQGDVLQPWKEFIAQQRETRRNAARQSGATPDQIARMHHGYDNADHEDLDGILANPDLINRVMQPIVGSGRNVDRDNVVVVDQIPGRGNFAYLRDQYNQNIRLAMEARRNPDPLEDNTNLEALRTDGLSDVAINRRLYHATLVNAALQQAGLRNEATFNRRNEQINQIRQAVIHNPNPVVNDDEDPGAFAVGGRDQFIRAVRENNIAQHIVLRLDRHWIATTVEQDQNSAHGVSARIINSTHRNVTNEENVNDLLQECSIN